MIRDMIGHKWNSSLSWRFIILLLVCMGIPNETRGNDKGWEIGVRNSRYLFAHYRFGEHFSAGLRHSLFSQAMRYQQVGIEIGYSAARDGGRRAYGLALFADTEWDGGYRIAGADLSFDWRIVRGLKLGCVVEPRYDTGYDFKLCYRAGLGYVFNNIVTAGVAYTTIPDIRKSEKRLHAGCRLSSGNLSVQPVVSIPLGNPDTIQKTRLLLSFSYSF